MTNPLCHFELMTADPAKCRAFYESVFDWQFDDKSMPGYTLVDTGTAPTGAIFPKPNADIGACTNMYFQVDDIDKTLAAVTEKGGKVIIPKTEIPGIGHFAMFTDPEGIPIGIMRSAG